MKRINLFMQISALLFIFKYSNISDDVSYWSVLNFFVVGLIYEYVYFIAKESEILHKNSQKLYDTIDDVKRAYKIRVERRKIEREYRKRRINELKSKK